jgi:hypothetical protein
VELYPYRPADHYAIVDHAPEYDRVGSYPPIPDRSGLGVDLVEERVAPFLWAEWYLFNISGRKKPSFLSSRPGTLQVNEKLGFSPGLLSRYTERVSKN